MPGVDKQCSGTGATHHLACKCREEYFAKIEKWASEARDVLGYYANLEVEIPGFPIAIDTKYIRGKAQDYLAKWPLDK